MYIKAIYGIDTQCQNLLGLFLYLTSRTGYNSHIHIFQFGDVLYHLVCCEFCRFVFSTVTTDDTCNLKIRCRLSLIR